MTNRLLALFASFLVLAISSPLFAQEVIQISDAYSCIRLANGTSYISQNGKDPGDLTIIDHNSAFKAIKADRKTLRGRIETLKNLRGEIVFGTFDKADKRTLKGLLDYYFPSDKTLNTRKQRLAATDELIKHLRSEIELLNAIEKAVSDCLGKRPGGKPSYLPYGQVLPVTVKPVIIPGSAAWSFREAYVGYLVTIKADKTINIKGGKKIGTRSGYIACIKNLTTGKTFYTIFDDQPCEDVTFSPQFPDLAACKKLVPTDTWGLLGYWAAAGGAYPNQEQIQSSYNFMLANVRPYFQAVIYGADPYKQNGGPSQLDFRTWCSTGAAY